MKSVSGSVLIILLCKLNDLGRITTPIWSKAFNGASGSQLICLILSDRGAQLRNLWQHSRAFAHDPFRTTVSESQADVTGEMCLLSGKHLQALEQVITSNADCKQCNDALMSPTWKL